MRPVEAIKSTTKLHTSVKTAATEESITPSKAFVSAITPSFTMTAPSASSASTLATLITPRRSASHALKIRSTTLSTRSASSAPSNILTSMGPGATSALRTLYGTTNSRNAKLAKGDKSWWVISANALKILSGTIRTAFIAMSPSTLTRPKRNVSSVLENRFMILTKTNVWIVHPKTHSLMANNVRHAHLTSSLTKPAKIVSLALP